MTSDTETRPMTFADQVALVDAVAVATRIEVAGSRQAIQASTIEIIAMARRLLRLNDIIDLTHDMLAFSDVVVAQRDRAVRELMRRELKEKISVIGASLEALGYGQSTAPASAKETNHGQG